MTNKTQNKPREITATTMAETTGIRVYWVPSWQRYALKLKNGLYPIMDQELNEILEKEE